MRTENVTVRTWSGLVEQPSPDSPTPNGGGVPDGGDITASAGVNREAKKRWRWDPNDYHE